MIPNANILSKHLSTLAQACSATEVILFERTTFLVVATSSETDQDTEDPHKLDGARYERTSELIKAFKYSCAMTRREFHSLEVELSEFTAVLDELTRNTYVLIVVHNPTIGPFFLLSLCDSPSPSEWNADPMRAFCFIRNRCAENEHLPCQE